MYFANPWGLLGLLSLPAIAAIHLYHRRFPITLISGAHLWGVETEVRAAGRRRERLPITATLLLELLAALLLTLVLSQPRFGNLTGVTHLVVVLDNSASMQGKPPGGKAFRERAIDVLTKRVEGLDRGSLVTLITSGRRPVMLAGPAVPWDEAEPKLKQWRPTAPAHDFHSAWDLSAQLAARSGELLFLTDRVPTEKESLPKRMEVVSVGERLENVAITTARWSFDTQENAGRVFLRISNLGREAAQATITGQAKEQRVFSRTVSLAAGKTVPLESPVAGGLGRITIDVKAEGDGLEVDNRVTLIEPRVRQLHVALTVPQEDAAFATTKRVLDSVPDLELSDVANAELIIGPGNELPESRDDLWWLGVGPLDRSEAARKQSKTFRDTTPYVLEKRNPLLEGVVLGGIFWGGVQETKLDVAPLIRYDRFPLLARLNGTRTRAYLLNIDFSRSNLQQSPDWPILLSNLTEARRDNLPGLRRWNYRLNEEIRFRLYEGAGDEAEQEKKLVLIHDGRERPVTRMATVELPPIDATGVYTLRDGEDVVDAFSVNYFDEAESTLTALREGYREPLDASKSGMLPIDQPYSWVLLVGIVLILGAIVADWVVLRPRKMV
ncbi:MAG: hypothetical protein CMJ48_00985 [Planctomycetaceae bacterium]|nr:hypothetical protein [Planctomycetaceae bacterium]